MWIAVGSVDVVFEVVRGSRSEPAFSHDVELLSSLNCVQLATEPDDHCRQCSAGSEHTNDFKIRLND